jgi:hypothetical protein
VYQRFAVTALFAVAAAAPAVAQTPNDPIPAAAAAGQAMTKLPNDSMAIARRYVSWLWSNQADSLLAHSPRDTSVTREQISNQLAQISAQIGTEQEVVEEKWVRRNGRRQYWRTARFSDFTQEPVVLRLVILPDGRMAGMGLNPLSAVPPTEPDVP